MKLNLLVVPLLLVFALCVTLGGPTRAMDDASSDSDDIVCSANDLVAAQVERVSLEPPSVRVEALPQPSEMNSGRRVSADLFRPPITA